ncbi:hypothetical protein DFH09DRAFT_1078358 [Mycena vulgaris]|nr:hypothetical protein DFH09DRAFT_1078358 [Mycena vulgaris]
MSDPAPLRRSSRQRGPPRHADSPVSFVQPAADQNEILTIADDSDSEPEGDAQSPHIHDDLIRDLEAGIEASAIQRASDAFDTLVDDEIAETVAQDSPSPDPFHGRGETLSTADFELMLHTNFPPSSGGFRADSSLHSRQSIPNRRLDPERSDDEESSPETLSIASVDSGEGSLQERADRLVQHVVRLQDRDSANILAASAAPLQPFVGAPRAPIPVATTFTALQDGDEASQALYFVGIQTLEQCRTFCQMRSFAQLPSHDGAIFQRLQAAGGPVGRALAAITDRAVFFVGTSDFPVDMAHGYTGYQHRFREVNSLLDLESSYGEDAVFFPIPGSPTRSALLRTQRLSENTPVFVLYVYHQDAEPLRNSAAAPPPTEAAALVLPPAPTLHATLPALVPIPGPDAAIHSYLHSRFSLEFSELAGWRASLYGSAYIHCLTERGVLQICQALNIGHLGRSVTPAVIGSMIIHMDHVVEAAGVNRQTFGTYRTELRLIKQAHIILRRLDRGGALLDSHRPFLTALELMLGDRILPVTQTASRNAEGEFTVVSWTITSLMAQIRSIIDNNGNV